MLGDKLVECWEVNLAEPGESTNQGKYKAKYYQGFLTECSTSSSADGNVEVSLTFGANGNGADGYASLTKSKKKSHHMFSKMLQLKNKRVENTVLYFI